VKREELNTSLRTHLDKRTKNQPMTSQRVAFLLELVVGFGFSDPGDLHLSEGIAEPAGGVTQGQPEAKAIGLKEQSPAGSNPAPKGALRLFC
jgi:hypothetical protein